MCVNTYNTLFNDNYTTSSSDYSWDVQAIALHELGHSLGLGHNSNSNAVMFLTGRYRNLSVYDEYYFYQIYKNQIAGGSKIMDNPSIGELDQDYWVSRDFVLSSDENNFNLRQIPEKTILTQSDYDFETYVDILYIPLDDVEMIDFSDLIVKGHVKEITPAWWNTVDGKKPTEDKMLEYNLYHNIVIEVDEVYKGKLTDNTKEVTICQIGGTFNGVRQTSSIPNPYIGEEVIFYLVEESLNNNKNPTYIQVNEKGQIFVIDDDLGVNALGQKVNLEKDVIKQIQKITI